MIHPPRTIRFIVFAQTFLMLASNVCCTRANILLNFHDYYGDGTPRHFVGIWRRAQQNAFLWHRACPIFAIKQNPYKDIFHFQNILLSSLLFYSFSYIYVCILQINCLKLFVLYSFNLMGRWIVHHRAQP